MWPFRKRKVEEKLNPAQRLIGMREGAEIYSRENCTNYRVQYEKLEIVNRGVNMIVDDAADIPCEVGNKLKGVTPVAKGVKPDKVFRLLNYEPNPYQDINSFKRNLIIDLLLDGNIFIYYDGNGLYHIPSNKMTIQTDEKTFIKGYTYEGQIEYSPSEIINIKENSFYSIYRGISRLNPAEETMALLNRLRQFQLNFFRNGAVPGLVLTTPDVLSDKVKERMMENWTNRYRPEAGGRRPLILDGGLKVDSLSNVNFSELDFQDSCIACEHTILKALGIPPVLFEGGNNVTVSINHRLYYLETIIPIVRKINAAFSRFFGYEIFEDVTDTPALQPALRDQSAYFTGLVNGGIFTPNEARVALGKQPLEGLDDIRVPVNIAGSAVNPTIGGRPIEGDEDE